MEKNKLKENIIFNVIKTLVTILYPIIMFVYVTHIISVEGLGRVTFAKNFVSYFCMLASLGINYYGIREGAKIAKDKNQFSKFFWEILTINKISTAISFFILLITIFMVKGLVSYRILLLMNSISVIIGGIGSEWVLGALEEYKFISLRTIIIQLMCMILAFIFIKCEADYMKYAVLLVLSGYGPYVFNYVFILKHKIIKKIPHDQLEYKKHLKPILVLFAMLVSIEIYTLLDSTMLGFVRGDYAVGIYTAAIKIPRLINSVIASVGTVLVPRLALYCENNISMFYYLIKKVVNYIFLVTIPCAIGIFIMADEIIMLICGEKYIPAILTLRILSFLVYIIPINVLFNNQIFIPMRKEKYVLQSTCLGAVINIILNSILIPEFAENGAAIATVLAELTVMRVCLYHVRKELKLQGMFKIYRSKLAAGVVLIPVMLLCKLLLSDIYVRLLLTIIICIIVYISLCYKDIKEILSGLNNR